MGIRLKMKPYNRGIQRWCFYDIWPTCVLYRKIRQAGHRTDESSEAWECVLNEVLEEHRGAWDRLAEL